MTQIQGAGGGGGGKGGGGGGRVPQEAADTLQSVQYAEILDLLSEGEIGGLEAGAKSVFLDDVPVENADGTQNFSGYTIEVRNGTQSQSYIPTLGGAIQSENGVNVRIFNGSPLTRSITNINVDRVRITVAVPALQRVNDKGDVKGFVVDWKIEIQYNNGGFQLAVTDGIIGKTSSRYSRDWIVPLNGAFPVDIRVSRVSEDETSATRQNELWWVSYTEIIDAKLRYPNSALVGLRFDARQFSNIPRRKYKILGIKVQLPVNASVDTTTHKGRVTYSGIWNGTFGPATWTNDPAWCFYDLLTNTRYGADIPANTLDKFDFYSISQYCNQLVPDGKGGQEVRFACNILINERREVYEVIQQMISVFRGIAYYGIGSMALLQDRPSDSQYVLGPSNVIDGVFTYSGSAQKARHTTATVAWQSYASLGETEYEYVELSEAVAKYGIINKQIQAIGCYSQGQAQRLGKWLLLSESILTETVSFAVGIESGVVLRPGMVIDIADPVKSGSRRSGRVSAATTSVITLDNSSGLTAANSPTIAILMPTGILEKHDVAFIDGAVVTVASPFSQVPSVGSVWLVETTNIQSQQFRVATIAEGSDDGTYAVTALEYNSSIYDAIDLGTAITERDISDLTLPPESPYDLLITEYLYEDGAIIRAAVDISWQSTMERVAEFRFSYRIDQDNWTTFTTLERNVKLLDVGVGLLQVEVRAMNFVNRGSPAAVGSIVLTGKTSPPGDVQNLSFEAISFNSGRLRWDATTDLDVRTGGRVVIRHSAKADGSATWSDSIDLISAVAGYSTEAIVPLLEGEILVKFEDDGGRQSRNETSVIIDLPDPLARFDVIDRRESADEPPFQGQKNGVFYSETDNALKLETQQFIDDVTNVDSLYNFDNLTILVGGSEVPATGTPSVRPYGTYDFLNLLDLDGIYDIDLSRYFVTRANYLSDLIDNRTPLVDSWSDWDGLIADKVNARLLVSHTNLNYIGTYSQSGNTVTVNVNGHGYIPSDQITVDITSGNAVEGTYVVATASANSLTYTALNSQTASGNIKLIGGGQWAAFQDLAAGTYKGRAFRFRAALESNAIDQNILVDELGYSARFQVRIENSNGIVASGAGVKSITFAHKFWTGTAALGGVNAYLPSIGITAHNMAHTEDFVVTNVSATGFNVEFKQDNSSINRNFSWTAVGYGKGG